MFKHCSSSSSIFVGIFSLSQPVLPIYPITKTQIRGERPRAWVTSLCSLSLPSRGRGGGGGGASPIVCLRDKKHKFQSTSTICCHFCNRNITAANQKTTNIDVTKLNGGLGYHPVKIITMRSWHFRLFSLLNHTTLKRIFRYDIYIYT